MIYLSAQPDEFYFTWQLDVQLYNFEMMGLKPVDIHVLIAVNPRIGLQNHCKETIEANQHRASFYTYPDLRICSNYAPSIRPHIIWQHLEKFPELQLQTIFYHDSDVIFRQLPDFASLLGDECWYVSNTRDYLNSLYIVKFIGSENFHRLCELVGIDPEIVKANDQNSGGAQYILKNTSPSFWGKVEKDSEIIFKFLEEINASTLIVNDSDSDTKKPLLIQSWCADMWSILWNALILEKAVVIHPELDFCWPKDSIDQWHSVNMLHYSGVGTKDSPEYFCKVKYKETLPFYDVNLARVSKENSSYPLVQLINKVRDEKDEKRTSLKDLSILIPVRADSVSRLENLYILVWYLNRFFDTHIIIAESDIQQRIDLSFLPLCCSYYFVYDDNPVFHRTRINNFLIGKADTDIISIYDTDVILPVAQIEESILLIRTGKASIVSPYDGRFISADTLFKTLFSRMLDEKLLCDNIGKMQITCKRSYGGAVFMRKSHFITSGMENEYLTSWGPDDIERIKRMRHLGYNEARVAGPLFHMPHERKENSGYQQFDSQFTLMEEYFKICDMSYCELVEYISTWPWVPKSIKYE